MGWILGAAGVGGIGLALAFIPGAAKAAVEALTTAWGWATRNPAAALCGLFLAIGAWCWHGWSKEQSRHKADNAACIERAKIDHASIATLQASIATQNAAVQALGDASAAKQKQSAKIVADAVAHGKSAEAAAVRIEQERKVWPKGGPVCRTGEAVLQARGEL